MPRKKRALTRAVTNDSSPLHGPLSDPWTLAPDELRNQVQRRLARLGEADRKVWRRRLLAELAQAGVHIPAALFMMGIPAANLDELTPVELGKLLRYVRINVPAARAALAGPLTELLIVNQEPARAARRIPAAA